MFTTLVESRSIRVRSAKSTMMSVMMHGAVIAAAVAMTLPARGDATPRPPKEKAIVYVAIKHPPTVPSSPTPPHSPPAPSRTSFRSIVIPMITPTKIPPIDVNAPELPPDLIITSRPHTPMSPFGSASLMTFLPGSVVNADAVERIPRIIGNPPLPRYPNALRASEVTGNVVARFVVDTLGRAEMDGVVIVEATHSLFADAVKSALEAYRFSPGEVAGRKVRTMVQVPFTFALTR